MGAGANDGTMNARIAAIPVLRQPFYFLRHGETVSNVDDTIAGSLDVALTARGIEQARAAASKLRDRGVGAVHCSRLRRAKETAEYVAAALRLSVTVIPELAERSWGELEGKPRRLRVAGVTPPGGEKPEAFRDRVLRGLGKIAPGGLPLIVAHSGVFRVLCDILRLPPQEARIDNARPVRFAPPAEGGAWSLEGT
jgi:broad specificity phosphatase PhoE